jgi:hypothetical protein
LSGLAQLLFIAAGRSNRLCFSLSLFVGVSLSLPSRLTLYQHLAEGPHGHVRAGAPAFMSLADKPDTSSAPRFFASAMGRHPPGRLPTRTPVEYDPLDTGYRTLRTP